ncbi:hypothetical protein [Bryobacter aggregatus]|uniref:hypothetical protein n=1 Tax=Bryobacter aggregatus TaxID=360054 RepID=UPI0004E231A5|nr:hypothetical protein [Bryobacter aggregatus]
MNIDEAIGYSPEELSLPLRDLLTGQWVALEIYDIHRLPLRKIVAVGGSATACFTNLSNRGLNPLHFEVVQLPAPF